MFFHHLPSELRKGDAKGWLVRPCTWSTPSHTQCLLFATALPGKSNTISFPEQESRHGAHSSLPAPPAAPKPGAPGNGGGGTQGGPWVVVASPPWD